MGAVCFSNIFFLAFFSSQWHQDEIMSERTLCIMNVSFLVDIYLSKSFSILHVSCMLSSITTLQVLIQQFSVYFPFAITCTNLWYYSYPFEKESLFAIPFTNPIWYYIFFLVWTLISTFMFSKTGNKIRCKTIFIGKRRVQLILK